MTDPIRREQVERAIVAARVGTVYLSDFLGPGINWSLHAPDYVCRLWISPPRPPQAEHIAALTRWRDELVAAETPRAAPDDTAPERLRERREALGLTRRGMAVIVQRHETGDVHWEPEDIRICEIPANPPHRASGRATYAAALSAAEAERADADRRAFVDSYPDTSGSPDAPRTTAYARARAKLDAMSPDELVAFWERLKSIDPHKPAPDVVDVPQPLVKRFGGVEASWGPGRLDVITLEEINGDDEPFDVPIAILRAMLEAIDAQQGGAS